MQFYIDKGLKYQKNAIEGRYFIILICSITFNPSKYSISFNPSKSKLLCLNVDSSNIVPVFIKGKRVEVIQSDVHLGNYISTNITDRNIVGHVCDLYQRSNSVISDFNVCDSVSLDSLHQTYSSVSSRKVVTRHFKILELHILP